MKHYVYIHIREDDLLVFYVGKGSGRRAWQTSGRPLWWKRVAKKHGFSVHILATYDDEKDAYEAERLLIATYRQLDAPLVNATDGGEGQSKGWKMSPEAKAKQREGMLRAGARERARVGVLEMWTDPRRRAATVKSMSAERRTRSPEQILQAQAKAAAVLRARARRFRCIETGIEFQCLSDAARWLGKLDAESNIAATLKGRHARAYGYHWKYLDEVQA